MDVGGAYAFGCDVIALTCANVGALSRKFPGAIYIIMSALRDVANDVIEEIKEREMEEDALVLSCPEYGIDNLCDIIEKY